MLLVQSDYYTWQEAVAVVQAALPDDAVSVLTETLGTGKVGVWVKKANGRLCAIPSFHWIAAFIEKPKGIRFTDPSAYSNHNWTSEMIWFQFDLNNGTAKFDYPDPSNPDGPYLSAEGDIFIDRDELNTLLVPFETHSRDAIRQFEPSTVGRKPGGQTHEQKIFRAFEIIMESKKPTGHRGELTAIAKQLATRFGYSERGIRNIISPSYRERFPANTNKP